jgi:hypothetical protein
MDHQQDDADDEENPRDLRSDRRHTSSAKHASDQPNDKKYQSVIQHCDTSLANVIKHTVCRNFQGQKHGEAITLGWQCRKLLQPELARGAQTSCDTFQTSGDFDGSQKKDGLRWG